MTLDLRDFEQKLILQISSAKQILQSVYVDRFIQLWYLFSEEGNMQIKNAFQTLFERDFECVLNDPSLNAAAKLAQYEFLEKQYRDIFD
jgi:hypothetical protein